MFVRNVFIEGSGFDLLDEYLSDLFLLIPASRVHLPSDSAISPDIDALELIVSMIIEQTAHL